MKTVFFTIVSDNYYYEAGTPVLINSFKRYHPDIDLIVFRQDMVDSIFKEKKINFYMAKPTFAKLLTPYYEKVVNIDCDHIVLGRLEEILKDDYDIACPTNLNDYENMELGNITKEKYLQGGLVASTSYTFWDTWEKRNKDAMKYRCRENDIMNLVIYEDMKDRKLKILDEKKDYYGCKSLNREKEFYLEGEKVMCRKEQVLLYHVAKGGVLPKFNWDKLGFPKDVTLWMQGLAYYGKTVRYGAF